MRLEQAYLDAPAGIRPLRAAVLCLAAGLLCCTIPFAEHAALYTLVALLFGCLIGPPLYDWYRGRLDFFEPLHVVGVIYFTYFGLGALWTVHDPSRVAYDIHLVDYVPQALFYCLLGYVALLVGYYAPWRTRPGISKFVERPRGVVFLLATGGLGLVGFAAQVLWQRSASLGGRPAGLIGSLGQLSPLFLFAWALAWMHFFSRHSSFRQRVVLFSVFLPGALAIAYFTFSNKTLVMTLVGLPIIALWYGRRKIPVTLLIVLLLVLIFLVFPLYNTYRNFDKSIPHAQRMAIAYQTVSRLDTDDYLSISLVNFKVRMAMINSVALVVRDVGRWVPYAKGETLFMPLLTFFVPRVIWPDKPMFVQGREFGTKFRVVNALDRETHIDATVPGELYWNFDLPGILVGMGLWGLLMGFLYRRYGGPPGFADPVRRAVHIMLLFEFATVGGAVAPTMVGIVRTLLVVEALRWAGRHYGALEVVPSGGRH